MKYVSKKTKKSRFKDFIRRLDERQCARTLRIMDRSLLENKEYEDKKN